MRLKILSSKLFFNGSLQFKIIMNNKNIMSHTREELRSMLEDVVTVLDLSEDMVEKHGPLGTAPADLVRLVLEQKDKQIRMLKLGMKQIEVNNLESTLNPEYENSVFTWHQIKQAISDIKQ